MPTDSLSRSTLLSEAGIGWKVGQGRRAKVIKKDMKTLANGLFLVGPARLLGWSARDPLYTIGRRHKAIQSSAMFSGLREFSSFYFSL